MPKNKPRSFSPSSFIYDVKFYILNIYIEGVAFFLLFLSLSINTLNLYSPLGEYRLISRLFFLFMDKRSWVYLILIYTPPLKVSNMPKNVYLNTHIHQILRSGARVSEQSSPGARESCGWLFVKVSLVWFTVKGEVKRECMIHVVDCLWRSGKREGEGREREIGGESGGGGREEGEREKERERGREGCVCVSLGMCVSWY